MTMNLPLLRVSLKTKLSADAWRLLSTMPRSMLFFAMLTCFWGASVGGPAVSYAWQTGGISSEHVHMLLPLERESLGRELIGDIERCYIFMDKATDGSLPRKIYITVDWDRPDTRCSRNNASIVLGMSQSVGDVKEFLFYSAAREIAHMGLLELSGGAQREDTEFLFEGMIEILVHEYNHTSRRLEAAWVFSKYLDELHMLGLANQRSWSEFSAGKRCLRTASPGITFLTTFRLLQGRGQPIKLFKALRKKGLSDSLTEAFKAPIAELESTWLQKVREYHVADEITTAAEEAPQLREAKFVPETGRPGAELHLRLSIADSARNLLPNGVFVRDERTGRLTQVQAVSDANVDFLEAAIPIETDCPPGQYKYQVTAIDETGNVRRWNGSYTVGSMRQ
jgi:hypothetical protein